MEDTPALPLIPVTFRLNDSDPWLMGYFTPTEYHTILTAAILPSGVPVQDIRVNSFLPEDNEFLGTHVLYCPRDKAWRFSYES